MYLPCRAAFAAAIATIACVLDVDICTGLGFCSLYLPCHNSTLFIASLLAWEATSIDIRPEGSTISAS